MGLAKQAKPLSKRQIALVTAFLQQTRHPDRNRAVFLLSVKAGLRAKEIASLTWDMLTDAEGNLGSALHLRDEASKGSSGRVIPLNKELRAALEKLHSERSVSPSPQGTAESSRNTTKMTRWIAPCSTVVRPVPSVSVLTNKVSTKSVMLLGDIPRTTF